MFPALPQAVGRRVLAAERRESSVRRSRGRRHLARPRGPGPGSTTCRGGAASGRRRLGASAGAAGVRRWGVAASSPPPGAGQALLPESDGPAFAGGAGRSGGCLAGEGRVAPGGREGPLVPRSRRRRQGPSARSVSAGAGGPRGGEDGRVRRHTRRSAGSGRCGGFGGRRGCRGPPRSQPSSYCRSGGWGRPRAWLPRAPPRGPRSASVVMATAAEVPGLRALPKPAWGRRGAVHLLPW